VLTLVRQPQKSLGLGLLHGPALVRRLCDLGKLLCS
jgi:hypothetical protein